MTCGIVGGALRRPGYWSAAPCGARTGAPSARPTATTSSERPTARVVSMLGSLARQRIHGGERHVRHQRAEREKERSGSRAAGHEVHVAGAQRVEHQLAEAGP